MNIGRLHIDKDFFLLGPYCLAQFPISDSIQSRLQSDPVKRGGGGSKWKFNFNHLSPKRYWGKKKRDCRIIPNNATVLSLNEYERPKQRNSASFILCWEISNAAIALCLFFIDESQSEQQCFLYALGNMIFVFFSSLRHIYCSLPENENSAEISCLECPKCDGFSQHKIWIFIYLFNRHAHYR